jgi:hypothetical protein
VGEAAAQMAASTRVFAWLLGAGGVCWGSDSARRSDAHRSQLRSMGLARQAVDPLAASGASDWRTRLSLADALSMRRKPLSSSWRSLYP